ncbi:MAG TPA: RNA polymerase sigma factor [Acidimicrobiales bacterium]
MEGSGQLDGREPVGDAEVFAALYPALRRLAAVTGGSDDDPDDLVQEAVARTLRALGRQGLTLAGLDNPGAYLRRTIVNLASNRRRSLARLRVAMSRVGRTDEASLPEYSSDLADLLRIDPRTRAVLYLVEVEDLTYAEAGALLGLTEEAARTRAARARRRLRVELLDELGGQEGGPVPAQPADEDPSPGNHEEEEEEGVPGG